MSKMNGVSATLVIYEHDHLDLYQELAALSSEMRTKRATELILQGWALVEGVKLHDSFNKARLSD